jgi:thiamine biosynthesis lipoprotein
MTAGAAKTAWSALGTTAEVVVTDAAALDAARAAVVHEVDAIDRACSRFRDDSELACVNAAQGAPVEVSRVMAHAVAVALRVARATDGLVDPTLGEDLRAAGYDRDFTEVLNASTRAGGKAGADATGARRPRPRLRLRPAAGGWRGVEVDELLGIVTVPRGVALDLGATAKALAADLAARAAHTATGAGVLVALGGDIALAGEAPAGGWVVNVADDHAARTAAQTITLCSGGLATSGTTVRRWRVGGEPRHHIIDPDSGAPARTPWRTVTIAAASCVDANGASTAALVRGADAPRWLAAAGLPARLVAVDGTVVRVAGWPASDDVVGDDREHGAC